MEDLYNITSENITDYLEYEFPWDKSEPDLTVVSYVTACIVTTIGLPLTLLAIYALYSMVKDNNVAPVYVINLLVSDLIQMCGLVMWVAAPDNLIISLVFPVIYIIGVMASVGFMVCVAMERYLFIAFPLWYRFRRTIKVSVVICIMVWILPLIVAFLDILTSHFMHPNIFPSIFLLLPFPLLIFFLVGTLKALSSSLSVPLEEKWRIAATLVLVLLNYTLLFLPMIILLLQTLTNNHQDTDEDIYLSFTFIQFSPLVDLVLYVFMRKGAVDKLLACLCRCRMSKEQETTVSDNTTDMVSSV